LLDQLDIKKLTRSKLKKHLEARDEPVAGNKNQLIERLDNSLEEEKLRGVAYAEALEAKHRQIADLEENGAVYVTGINNVGQLGLGDFEQRDRFTVLPMTRSLGVIHISSGFYTTCAVTKDFEVFSWGGNNLCPSGRSAPEGTDSVLNMEPQLIHTLCGEEVNFTTMGSSHGCAVSKGGDCFVWGHSNCGALGLQDCNNQSNPTLVSGLGDKEVTFAATGEHHSCVVTNAGKVYSWGHCAAGRLGIGAKDRLGVSTPKKHFFPTPSLVRFPILQTLIRLIACGVDHVLAVSQVSDFFSWGSGAGGRLGHGDFKDRWQPEKIISLDKSAIIDISAGTWHSACVVATPPLHDAGYLYTWVSNTESISCECVIRWIILASLDMHGEAQSFATKKRELC